MNIKTLTITACGAMLLCAGCRKEGDQARWIQSATYANAMGETHDFHHVVKVSYNLADCLYASRMKEFKSDMLEYRDGGISDEVGFVGWHKFHFYRSAYSKRVVALLMARTCYTYTFKNYINMDGVSGLIYNTAYVFSIPRKLLTGIFIADGICEYLKNSAKLLIGGVFAVAGIPCSFVINTICHPIETLANLTVGVAYFGDDWFEYVRNTNLVVSLWDLIWGGIIYPLWQALVFWL